MPNLPERNMSSVANGECHNGQSFNLATSQEVKIQGTENHTSHQPSVAPEKCMM